VASKGCRDITQTHAQTGTKHSNCMTAQYSTG
jgi:hypothetical protein